MRHRQGALPGPALLLVEGSDAAQQLLQRRVDQRRISSNLLTQGIDVFFNHAPA
jgi:hypothetical protein